MHIRTQVSSIGRFNMAVPSAPSRLTAQSPSVQQLRDRLRESLSLRVAGIPNPKPTLTGVSTAGCGDVRVAVLFSGGLDCTVLARMCDDVLPAGQGVDLLNVAFENPRVASQLSKQPPAGGVATATSVYEACPDRITGRKSFAELRRVCRGRAWRFFEVRDAAMHLLYHSSTPPPTRSATPIHPRHPLSLPSIHPTAHALLPA